MAAAAGDRRHAARIVRAAEMGADERERRARAARVSAIEGSEGAAAPGARAAQRRKDDDRARHRYRRVRSQILRAAAETVSAQSRDGEALWGQSGADRVDGEAE